MHRFWYIRLQKCCDLENRVMGPSRSLEVSPFNRVHTTSYWRFIVTKATLGLNFPTSCKSYPQSLHIGSPYTHTHICTKNAIKITDNQNQTRPGRTPSKSHWVLCDHEYSTAAHRMSPLLTLQYDSHCTCIFTATVLNPSTEPIASISTSQGVSSIADLTFTVKCNCIGPKTGHWNQRADVEGINVTFHSGVVLDKEKVKPSTYFCWLCQEGYPAWAHITSHYNGL